MRGRRTPTDPIYVYGRGEKRIGTAGAASEGGVAGADIESAAAAPGRDPRGDPGLIATQHSGGGKANQYFLRGFNLDHGTDFALYIDDMPMNFRTHGHGQGYLDVNGLIPETVERVDYRKGPYRATPATSASSARRRSPRTTRWSRSRSSRRAVRLPPLRRGRLGEGRRRRPAADRPGQVQRRAVGAARGLRRLLGLLKYSVPLGDGSSRPRSTSTTRAGRRPSRSPSARSAR
jgi:hypothetical protein